MATKDLGTKHTCFKCGTKFYDLKKPAPICPKCGADQRETPPPSKSKRAPRPEPVEEPENLAEDGDEAEDEDLEEDEPEDDEA